MHRSSPAHSMPPRGAAALAVVMVLFFIMSLVAAYASRNLIFEQRTSANNYRSTQAFEAAEAGLEWGLAMLNGGRIDDVCAPSIDPVRNVFRERYLLAAADGRIEARTWDDAGTPAPLRPSCVRGNAGWSCSCPAAGDPALVAPGGVNATPVFVLRFETVGGQPGLVRVFSQGCSGWGTPCIEGAGNRADANAEVNALVGLAPALTQVPVAAFTVRGDLVAPNAIFSNRFAEGVAINAGGTVSPDPDTNPNIIGPAGTPLGAPGSRVVASDPSLSGLMGVGGLTKGEMMFLAAFGAPPAAYRLQPAVVRVDCSADCADRLRDAADGHLGRVLWVDGDLVLPANTVLTLGTPADPVVLVVAGDISIGAGSNVLVNGLVYVRSGSLNATGSNTQFNGVFIAEGEAAGADEGRFTIVGALRIAFDPAVTDVLQRVQARQSPGFGSFARLPGSWRDFR
jgi:hypothetical protein